MWRDLGNVSVNPDLGKRVVSGITEEIAERDPVDLVRQRDDILIKLLKLKAATGGSLP
jgi:hypothetical protein